jgi:hypothetical protein
MAEDTKKEEKKDGDKKDPPKDGKKDDKKKKGLIAGAIALVVGTLVVFATIAVMHALAPSTIHEFNATIGDSGKEMTASTPAWELFRTGTQAEIGGFTGWVIQVGVNLLLLAGGAAIFALGTWAIVQLVKRKMAEEKKKTAAATATS